MRSLLAILFSLCLVLVVTACRTPRAGGGQAASTVEGQVEEVGRDDGTLTLRVGEERRKILVAPEAEIRIDDFRATFDDIEEGQRVRASLDESGVQTEGFRIQILDQGATAPTVTDERTEPDRSASSGEREPRGP
jgi:hypothetical protein